MTTDRITHDTLVQLLLSCPWRAECRQLGVTVIRLNEGTWGVAGGEPTLLLMSVDRLAKAAGLERADGAGCGVGRL
jgi:hypothetical protein